MPALTSNYNLDDLSFGGTYWDQDEIKFFISLDILERRDTGELLQIFFAVDRLRLDILHEKELRLAGSEGKQVVHLVEPHVDDGVLAVACVSRESWQTSSVFLFFKHDVYDVQAAFSIKQH